jgi:hypothetical protein
MVIKRKKKPSPNIQNQSFDIFTQTTNLADITPIQNSKEIEQQKPHKNESPLSKIKNGISLLRSDAMTTRLQEMKLLRSNLSPSPPIG